MKETVLLFALENINNVGEDFLRETTEYLIRSTSNDIEIKTAQFKPQNIYVNNKYELRNVLSYLVRRIAKCFKGNLAYRILNVSYQLKYTRFYKDQIKQVDRVITSVGMFKYSTQDFSYIYHLIAKICQKYQKPLMVSAPSIESYNPNDWRSKQLVEAANIPSVKMITTRDGKAGLAILKNYYCKKHPFLYECVGDPALWIPECYHVEKRNHTLDSTPFVGINVIRKGIFDDYNKSFSDDELFQIYVELIQRIEEKGWRWAVYSNGMEQDISVINELQSVLKFSDKHILNHQNAKEYIEIIKGFDAVFSARLHSCITAVSLGIPVVGFIWDNKIRYFSETTKTQQFFYEPKNMSAISIIHSLEQAMKSDYEAKTIEHLKNLTQTSIRKFLDISY